MLRRILISTSILTIAASFSFAQGCSSSSGGGTTSSSGSSSGSENDATGSSSGVSGSSSGTGDDATGSSSGTSSGSGSSGGADGPDMCTAPLSTVPASTIPGYMPVMQTIGACAATDISGYITACDSTTATNTTCNTWFTSAPAACATCLVGPTTGGDPGNPTGQGAIWVDNAGQNIGANVPGCLDKQAMNACAVAYQNAIECIFSAGCGDCMDQTSFNSCQNTVLAKGGGCNSYVAPVQNSCGADLADGGLLQGGACSTDQQVISVICGNGTGDGG